MLGGARVRWTVAVVAVLALIAATFATCRSGDDANRDAAPAQKTDDRRTPTDDAAKVPRRARTQGATPVAVESTTAENAAPEVDGFPALDVEVVRADQGVVAPGADVYVVPAGAKFVDGMPTAKMDVRARCRLVLPRSGKFDVGVDAGPLHAMALGVAVPRSEPLRLTLPPTDEVVVTADADVRAALPSGPPTSFVYLTSQPTATARTRPSRDESFRWGVNVTFANGAEEFRTRLPVGELAAVDGSPAFAASPDSVRVPGKIHLSMSGLLPAMLRFRFEPPNLVERTNGWLVVELEHAPTSPRPTYPLTVHFKDGRIDERYSDTTERLEWFPTTGGTVRWRGQGVVAGECFVNPSTPARPATADVVVDLDGTPPAAEPPANSRIVLPRETKLEVRPKGLGPSADPANCFLCDEFGGHGRSRIQPDGLGHIGGDLPTWVAAAQGDRVAGPQRVAEPPTDEVELTLEPGGFLIVACDTSPPAALGTLTIVRKDGAPLLVMGTGLLVRSVDAKTGNTIGPLPVGEHAFVLRLAGIEVGEVTATVRAGATETLRIPKLPTR